MTDKIIPSSHERGGYDSTAMVCSLVATPDHSPLVYLSMSQREFFGRPGSWQATFWTVDDAETLALALLAAAAEARAEARNQRAELDQAQRDTEAQAQGDLENDLLNGTSITASWYDEAPRTVVS